MKKKYEVVQVVPSDTATSGVAFKTLSVGGSSGQAAWSGPVIFDTKKEAVKFIKDGAPGAWMTSASLNDIYIRLAIIPMYIIDNSIYKPYKV